MRFFANATLFNTPHAFLSGFAACRRSASGTLSTLEDVLLLLTVSDSRILSVLTGKFQTMKLELQEKMGLAFILGLFLAKKNKKGTRATVIDLRGPAQVKLASREAQSGKSFWKRGDRDLRKLDGLVLHQMGFQRGPDPTRYLGIPAHYVITTDGTIAQLHDWKKYLYTSSALNSWTVSVEVAGNFRGPNGEWYQGDKNGRDTLNSAQVEALRELVGIVDAQMALNGSKLNSLWGHRQGSPQRQIDPGPEIWASVVPWANAQYGLEDTSQMHVGDGKPIPESWKGGTVA